jgi:Tol biopolymer transport system component
MRKRIPLLVAWLLVLGACTSPTSPGRAETPTFPGGASRSPLATLVVDPSPSSEISKVTPPAQSVSTAATLPPTAGTAQILYITQQTTDSATLWQLDYDPIAGVHTEQLLETVNFPWCRCLRVYELSIAPDNHFAALNARIDGGSEPAVVMVDIDRKEGFSLPGLHRNALVFLGWLPGTSRILVKDMDGFWIATMDRDGSYPLELPYHDFQDGAVSPDGQNIVLSHLMDGTFWFVGRDGVAGERMPVPDKEKGGAPFGLTWSPDGRKLAYFDNMPNEMSQIRVMDIETGQLKYLSSKDAHSLLPTWSRDGTALLYLYEPTPGIVPWYLIDPTNRSRGLWIAEVETEQYRELVPARDYACWSPAWLPDGSGAVFVSTRGGQSDIWVVNRDGSNLQQLTARGDVVALDVSQTDGVAGDARSPSPSLALELPVLTPVPIISTPRSRDALPLPVRDRALMLLESDVWKVEGDYPPEALTSLDDVSALFGWNWDRSQILLGRSRGGDGAPFTTDLWLVDNTLRQVRRLTRSMLVASASWSPVDDRVAYCERERGLKIVTLEGTVLQRLENALCNFVWSPDGKSIAVQACTPGVNHADKNDLCDLAVWRLSDNTLQRFGSASRNLELSPIWSTDGQQILFQRRSDGSSGEGETAGWYLLNTQSTEIRHLQDTPACATEIRRSPRADQVAYCVESNVYVMDFRGRSRWIAPGHSPVWAPDGKTLIYRDLDHQFHTSFVDTHVMAYAVGGDRPAPGLSTFVEYFWPWYYIDSISQ